MVVQLNDFALGPVSPALALLYALLGGLLAIVLIARARQERGGRRMRSLLYAALALGATAIWQSGTHALMGLWLDSSPLRFDVARLAAALGAGLVLAVLAAVLLGYGRLGPVRLAAAALTMVAAVALTQAGQLSALRAGGEIVVDRRLAGAALGLGIVAAVALVGTVARAQRMRGALAGAGVLAGSLTGTHLLAGMALTVRLPELGVEPPPVSTGWSGIEVGVPVLILGSVLLVMVWFLTLGSATRNEVRAILDPRQARDAIDPRILEEVRSRVALTTTQPSLALPVTPDGSADRSADRSADELADESADDPSTTPTEPVSPRAIFVPGVSVADAFTQPGTGRLAPGPRPTPGDGPTWQSMPVWGRAEIAANTGSHGSRPARGRRNRGRAARAVEASQAEVARNGGQRGDTERDPRPNSRIPEQLNPAESDTPLLAADALAPDALAQTPVSPATPPPAAPTSPEADSRPWTETPARRDPLPHRDPALGHRESPRS